MPRAIGFSTGSLARSDFGAALATLRLSRATAVELSALRESELPALLKTLDTLELAKFQYVSFHAPSAIRALTEADLVTLLEPVARRHIPIVVHADILTDFKRWQSLGVYLLIENMDKRKSTGRSLNELRPLFEKLPEARMCFDFAHARQIDPTLFEATRMLHAFKDRIAQFHISELNAASRHERLTFAGIQAIRSVDSLGLLPINAAIILEFDSQPQELDAHLELAEKLFPGSLRITQSPTLRTA